MTHEGENVYTNSVCITANEERSRSMSSKNVYENFSRHGIGVENNSNLPRRESEFIQNNQASDIDSKIIEIEKRLRKTYRIWLMSISALLLVVFLMSSGCLMLVFQLRRNTPSVINGFHEKLKTNVKQITADFTSFNRRLDEIHSREILFRHNFSVISSQINEIRIQDERLASNLTIIHGMIRKVQMDTRKNVSTIKDEIRSQIVEWKQIFSRNLTVMRHQFLEVQIETNTRLSIVQNRMDGFKNQFNKVNSSLLYLQTQLDEENKKSKRSLSFFKAELSETRHFNMMFNSSLFLILNQIHGEDSLRTDIRKNMENQTELTRQFRKEGMIINRNLFSLQKQVKEMRVRDKEMQSNISMTMKALSELQHVNKTLQFLNGQIEEIKSSEIGSFIGITTNQERDQDLHAIITLNRLHNKSSILHTSFGIVQNGLSKFDNLMSQLKGILLRNASIVLLGGNVSAGRVEILHDGTWGTICDDNWDIEDGHVVCRMLGFDRAISAPGNAIYGSGVGKIWLDEVMCNGTEHTLMNCTLRNWGYHDCRHSEDASAVCST